MEHAVCIESEPWKNHPVYQAVCQYDMMTVQEEVRDSPYTLTLYDLRPWKCRVKTQDQYELAKGKLFEGIPNLL